MKAFFNEAYKRLNSQTPVFFRKVGNVGMTVAAAGGAIITPEIAGAHIPDALTKVGAHLLTAGAIMKAVAHFACIDPPAPPNPPQQ